MPLDGYMYIVGDGRYQDRNDKWKYIGPVKGETPDDRFSKEGAFQIWYFKWDTRVEFGGPNRTQPKSVINGFRIKKEIDIATPTLFLAQATGSVFTGAHIYFRKAAGPKLQTFFHAVFSEVMIEKWEINLDGEDTNEEITFIFNWVELNYYPQVKDGTRKKGDPANMKQFCTSNPESDEVPRLFRKNKGGELQEGDLNIFN